MHIAEARWSRSKISQLTRVEITDLSRASQAMILAYTSSTDISAPRAQASSRTCGSTLSMARLYSGSRVDSSNYEPTADGTRLDWLTESDGFGGFFGKLTESVVVSLYSRDLRSNLERLKSLMEAETP